MNNTKNKIQISRSTFITVLAWIFIIFSGFGTLIAIAQNVMIHTMFPVDQMQEAMHTAKEKQNIPPVAEFMMTHFQLIFGAFLVMSAVTFSSSVALLKRKNWARVIFIYLLGFGIVWNIGGLFLQQAFFTSIPPPSSNAPAEFQSQFKSMATTMLVISTVMAIGFSVLFGWIIKRLTSQDIKKEFNVAF